ncbi:DUF2085 domain-containing protein [Phototrophicus methaneseepsis]|uniref:DUF2085 domain-containing protein n=1 Tax=Phototrophicus methaneseepsis TaxID=2710758 RepID=A0A7S8E5U0_9CHLR|nr:DUF2085 domain-containing protein [Phototrophicus methaneseepsis]QPC80843.1 DUF2085 domain-containing protein [Phototrophicus methaneseepsis]
MRGTQWVLKNWMSVFLVLFGLFNLLPFIAPILAHLGIDLLANLIYLLYAPLCHQMAHRSFFLFGDQVMYNVEQLPLSLTGNLSSNMLALKQLQGNDSIGWKVAWSVRMVYMYGSMWLFALLYAGISRHRRVKRLPVWAFLLLILPLALDGTTHMISDFSGGLFQGFRYTNEWLANLIAHTLPEQFYIGDGWGTFNAWMRLISGIGFGAAIVGFMFPIIASDMRYNSWLLSQKILNYEMRENRQKHLNNNAS